MKPIISALAAISIATTQAAPAASAEKTVSIVLVHGAFVDGSGWKATYDILSNAGYEVLVVQQPTIALHDDVAETERVIAKARHPVILVGHSYGGMVITEAGDNPKVRSLVYLAAFAPDAGESVSTLAEAPVPAGEHKAPLVAEGNYLLVDADKFSVVVRGRCRHRHNALHGCRATPLGIAGGADQGRSCGLEGEADLLHGDE